MESALYGIYALVVFVSEILLVRFLIRQQLVCKYRTPALSMKYSLYSEFKSKMGTRFKILSMHKRGCTGRRDAEITIGITGLSENLAGITG